MAPEVLTGEYTEASPSLDMWSMGCILYAMLCGNLPFGGGDTQEIKIAIKEVNFKFPAVPQLSYHCRKFIKGMLCLDPTRRLLTHALREHPWMNHHKLGKSPVTKAAKNILIDQPKVKLRSLTNRKEGGENTKNIGAKSPCGPPLLKLVGPGNYSSLQVKSTKWKAKTPGKGSIFSPNPIKHLNSPIYSPTPKPQNPKTPKPQNPKTPKPQNPKTPKPQNPKTPKPQNPKTPLWGELRLKHI